MQLVELKPHDLGVLAGLAEDWRPNPYDPHYLSNDRELWNIGKELGERLKALIVETNNDIR